MRYSRTPRLPAAGGLLASTLFLLGLSACTDEETIFVERPFFEDPPAAASGYLGYGSPEDQEEKFTVCGNCHIGTQSSWETSAHSDAWATLQNSGGAQAFCEGCHSVSERGNPAEGDVAYTATTDARYQDVQCESCHGPGQAHVANPEAGQPLASALVGADLEAGCGECHEGSHQPFVNEWLASPHSQVVTFAADRPECQACHRGQGTLVAWGEDSEYLEKDAAEHLPVVCVVCHDPHGSTNEHQLRFPVNTNSIETHLCARCHNRRTVPDPGSSHGLEPHSPESGLVTGAVTDIGWVPPGSVLATADTIRGTHGSERNPELCATCHLASFEVTDAITGEFVFQATGHLFRPIPCVDANGLPTGFEDDCELSTSARSYGACTASGCHADETAAFSALITKVSAIQSLADELHDLLLQVDPNLEEAGGEIDPTVATFTVAEGAFFNLALAEFGNETFGTNTVVGSSVHNPFLTEALLAASIDAVEREYGVMASIQDDWNARVQAILAQVR